MYFPQQTKYVAPSPMRGIGKKHTGQSSSFEGGIWNNLHSGLCSLRCEDWHLTL